MARASERFARIGLRRGGMTLVELLVVVAIVTLVFAMLANSMRPALESRKTKEASRILSVAFAQAKARAMELGRPVGVWIQGGDTLGDVNYNFSTEVYLAESPLPYSGDFEGSGCTLTSATTFTVAKDQNSLFAGQSPQIRRGDFVKFNHREPAYLILGVNDPDPMDIMQPVTVNFSLARNGIVHPRPRGIFVPYQVLRQPVRTGPAIELPTGACIDLRNSGTGPGITNAPWVSPMADGMPTDLSTHEPPPGVEFQLRVNESGNGSVLVLFSPNGDVKSVVRNAESPDRNVPLVPSTVAATNYAPATIHFLIGKLDQMDIVGTLNFSSDDTPNEPFSYNRNLTDPGSLWVSVGARSGNVTSSPNNFSVLPVFTASLQAARFFASEAQNLGAR